MKLGLRHSPFRASSYLALGFLSFFQLQYTWKQTLVYRSDSDFPVRNTPTKAPAFVLQDHNMFLRVEQIEYNVKRIGKKARNDMRCSTVVFAASPAQPEKGKAGGKNLVSPCFP
jgi:hypothetical protein